MRKLIFVLSLSFFWLDATYSYLEFKSKVLEKQGDIPGWCSKEKAEKLMDLIVEVKPTICVEIGVFGGSSIYPTASALKFLQSGVVYAIDPWEAGESVSGYSKGDPNYKWWKKINYEKVYLKFQKMIKHFQLKEYCKSIRKTSRSALKIFDVESIDILHIDGNHSKEIALEDVKMYLPKVKRGGYIWFDDANWESTSLAIEYLNRFCIFLPEKSVGAECLLFQKP